ncbi:MAG: hypothetical protein ACR2IE_04970 [Candidatus Sumerlaeaceae bacterium]
MADPNTTLVQSREMLVSLRDGIVASNLQLETLSAAHDANAKERQEHSNALYDALSDITASCATAQTNIVEANGELIPIIEGLGNYLETEHTQLTQEATTHADETEQLMQEHHEELVKLEQSSNAHRDEVADVIARFEEAVKEQVEAHGEFEHAYSTIADDLVNARTHLDELIKAHETARDALLEHVEEFVAAIDETADSFVTHLDESKSTLEEAREETQQKVFAAYNQFRESVLATIAEINSDMAKNIDVTLQHIEEISNKLEADFDEAWHDILRGGFRDIAESIVDTVGGYLFDNLKDRAMDYAEFAVKRAFPVAGVVITFLEEADEIYSGIQSIYDILETISE